MRNRWGNSGNSVRLYFWGSKIIADGDCSHEIKRCLLLGSKAMTNLDSILKSRDNALPKKVCIVKAMVFPAVMYRCESWTIKKAGCQRIDAFELWCWRRFWESLGQQGDQTSSILKEIIHEYSLEELMLKWKLNHFGEKSLIIGNDPASGKDWSQEEKGATEDEMVGWHDWVNAHGFQQILGNSCPSWGCKETWLREWTTTKPQDI